MLFTSLVAAGLIANQQQKALCADAEKGAADASSSSSAAGAAGGGSDGPPANDAVSALIQRVVPIAAHLGFGGCIGFVTGYAVKRATEEAMYTVGMCFVGLQVLQHYGWIEIKYGAILVSIKKAMDADGDGKLTAKDFLIMWREIYKVLTDKMPDAAGFSSGLVLGLYYGK